MSNVSKIWKLDPHRTRKGQSYEEKNSIMDYDNLKVDNSKWKINASEKRNMSTIV